MNPPTDTFPRNDWLGSEPLFGPPYRPIVDDHMHFRVAAKESSFRWAQFARENRLDELPGSEQALAVADKALQLQVAIRAHGFSPRGSERVPATLERWAKLTAEIATCCIELAGLQHPLTEDAAVVHDVVHGGLLLTFVPYRDAMCPTPPVRLAAASCLAFVNTVELGPPPELVPFGPTFSCMDTDLASMVHKWVSEEEAMVAMATLKRPGTTAVASARPADSSSSGSDPSGSFESSTNC
ncbi:uncharacterized protein CcaverHIS019_0113550 [Cutaneotrichosporon cavernicola]|uniref:Uncharacterized protein n=1 Tax=Cutaneotrichosporon cavernicola TaxID=279322 RepID=A0AA48I9F6_9TREE|nr:uncharacterized protein CcaverHIS019_0113550 [Cutaneotrichosporon cavernicola]BEI88637.1 hypothetical protein CcaverHIS019_0113550 [Cutaneotrichosporon cavernicola]BEJ04182.1 hypothetical protein CcaverHIS641_0113570 [Cutaneotrichosporon cavernicola]